MKQADVIKQLTDRQLKTQLIASQLIFLVIGLLLSWIFFERLSDWFTLFSFKVNDLLLYGVLPAIGLVIFELILYQMLPKTVFDDGGINERIFKHQSILWIAFISAVVAISEEMLFRGVLQVTFGYWFASILFAVIHFRYLRKPLLFLFIFVTSFLIGYLFLITNNLIVTIVFHFMVDFLLGLFLKYQK